MQGIMKPTYARRGIAEPAGFISRANLPFAARRSTHICNPNPHILRAVNVRTHNLGKQHGGARQVWAPSAAAEAPASTAATEPSQAEDLRLFLTWLVANGVKGIGQEGSKVALFASEGGERGLVCEEPIAEGEVVLEVPLRLALTDYPEDDESNQMMYEGAPWSVRLACKLLRQQAAGDQSPWAPYIKVLPSHVPAPLESFSWEEISGLRYSPMQEALHAGDWLRADALANTSEEARGGLGEQELNWALSLVHSRTFANAAPGGGVGVRMLVPLVDMLNHGGDEVAPGTLGVAGEPLATDGVRWDLVNPDQSTTGGWAMVVRATTDLSPGEEMLLSYGERSNDDFFLHYGFVPHANPHDDAVLWPDLEASLEWHYERFGAQQLPKDQAEPLYLAALETGREEQRAEAEQRGGGDPEQLQQQQLPPETARQLAQIKVVAGGQVTAAVVRAFAAASGGDVATAERAVASRCAELLWNMAAPQPGASGDAGKGAEEGSGSASGGGGGLLADLAALLADADPRVMGDAAGEPQGGQARYWADQLRGYCKTLVPRYASLLPEGAAVAAAVLGTAAPPTELGSSPAAGAGIKSKYGLPPAAPVKGPAGGGADGGVVPLGKLVQALLPSATAAARLTGPQRLSTSFRCYKQMVLWDVLLGSSVDPEQLASFARGGGLGK